MNVNIKLRDSGTGQIGTVIYDRREKLNTLNSAGITELSEALNSLANNAELRAVVLTGAGTKAFFGGADITELTSLTPDTAKDFISSLHELFLIIRNYSVPVIARINGYTLGAGMELAAACDLRVASDGATFGMPEVRVGIPSVIEAALLPRLLGWGRSNYLVLTAENIDAKTAYDWGFLEAVTKETLLDKEVDRVADAIANSGPIAVRDQKQLVRDWEKLSLEDGIKAGIKSFSNAFKTDEPNRMMQPFLNRKKLSPN
jgi:enoyl-CoA hydratase